MRRLAAIVTLTLAAAAPAAERGEVVWKHGTGG
jgi:hypothetical protein